MPKLIIDNQEITVPDGTKIIDAAELLGIVIPRFCYHPALGAVGACRVCAVNCLEGPLKGIQMSCMIDAQDGMVVATADPEAMDFRKHVIEWLMLHHPHDCPVCDEGGHCLLQDLTVSGGHGIRQYQGPKRTHTDQDLGPLIQHEMNRCIQCYRCVRYYQEFTGYDDLGVMGIGLRVYYGRFRQGTLKSPFSGNLIDICPTGVYTDKPSRYKGRRWDFERSPSVCLHCSLGCHVTVSARYREVVRQEARFCEPVNGHFICDRGRYGFAYANHDDRPRTARVDGSEAVLSDALKTAAQRLDAIAWKNGPESVALVGSGRNSLQTQVMLKRLADAKGWRGPVFAADPELDAKTRGAVSRLAPGLAVSLAHIASSDCVLVAGVDPINEAPMLALALRQARRQGAEVTVIDPRPVSMPFDFIHLPARPSQMTRVIGRLIQEFGKIGESPKVTNPSSVDDRLAPLFEPLCNSRRPVIVCGTTIVPNGFPEMAADLAQQIRASGSQAGLFYILPGPNAFGAALLSNPDASFETILSGIEAGEIRALIVAETDLLRDAPDRDRLQKALDRLELLVVLDYLDTPAARAASVFIPTLTTFETRGVFINNEGRVQCTQAAFRGGKPIRHTGEGGHPPRSFRKDVPGLDMTAAWQALLEIGGRPAEFGPTAASDWLNDIHPALADLPESADFPAHGVRVKLLESAGVRLKVDSSHLEGATNGLILMLAEQTFGTEELSSRSPVFKELAGPPCLILHPDDAAGLGLAEGDTARIKTSAGVLDLPVQLVSQMATGVLVVPHLRDILDQLPGGGQIFLSKNQIQKASEEAP